MPEHDFASYQTTETAWRYSYRVFTLKAKIAELKKRLKESRSELRELESKPPAHHLFNWSA